jgi:hypothetical protein
VLVLTIAAALSLVDAFWQQDADVSINLDSPYAIRTHANTPFSLAHKS